MARGVRIQVQGLKELERKAFQLLSDTEKAVIAEVNWAGSTVRNRAERNAPKITGHLKDTILWHPATLQPVTDITVEADYAAFVEFGTGRRGAASGANLPDNYRHGSKQGQYARPYLFPAWEETRPEAERKIADAVRGAIRSNRE